MYVFLKLTDRHQLETIKYKAAASRILLNRSSLGAKYFFLLRDVSPDVAVGNKLLNQFLFKMNHSIVGTQDFLKMCGIFCTSPLCTLKGLCTVNIFGSKSGH